MEKNSLHKKIMYFFFFIKIKLWRFFDLFDAKNHVKEMFEYSGIETDKWLKKNFTESGNLI